MLQAGKSLLPELVEEILLRLHFRDIVACQQVCKLLNEIINESVRLQYQIELGSCHMVESGYNNELSTAERLKELKRLHEGWRTLKWTKVDEFEIDHWFVAYDLQGGIFVAGHDSSTSHGFFHRTMQQVKCTRLESNRCNQPRISWKQEDLGFLAKDLTTDPVQDLAAYLTLAPVTAPGDQQNVAFLHLQTLSENKPHPLAKNPLVTFKLDLKRPGSSAYLQICGIYIGVLVQPSAMIRSSDSARKDYDFLIFEWQTGTIHARMSGSGGMDSFIFLSDSTLLVANGLSARPAQIEIYTIPPRSKAGVPPGGIPPSLAHTHSYQLPETIPLLGEILVRADPINISPNCIPRHHNLGDIPPFCPAPESRLLVFHWGTLTNDPARRFNLFVLSSTFLRPSMSSSTDNDITYPIVMPWSQWGPSSTRLFETLSLPQWVLHVHGTRHANFLPGEYRDGALLSRVQIMDFGLGRPRPEPAPSRSGRKRRDRDFSERLIEIEHLIAPGDIFKETVETCLPYYMLQTRELFDEEISGIMIDMERLVVTERQDDISSIVHTFVI